MAKEIERKFLVKEGSWRNAKGTLYRQGYLNSVKERVVRVRTNPKFFRPAEVDLLIGDPSLAEKELGWVPKTSFEELVQMMVDADMATVQEAVDGGYAPPTPPE